MGRITVFLGLGWIMVLNGNYISNILNVVRKLNTKQSFQR